ncbi:hypothetical protein ACM42_22995 [Bradyrhizobium sp. CCBAU 25338]|nr:hypothetical protein [Bradyrhizobium sp. CCBAU 25338]
MKDYGCSRFYGQFRFVQSGQRKMMSARDILAGEFVRFADIDEDSALVDETARRRGIDFRK